MRLEGAEGPLAELRAAGAIPRPWWPQGSGAAQLEGSVMHTEDEADKQQWPETRRRILATL